MNLLSYLMKGKLRENEIISFLIRCACKRQLPTATTLNKNLKVLHFDPYQTQGAGDVSEV